MWRPSRRQIALGVLLVGAVGFLVYSLRPPQAPKGKSKAKGAGALLETAKEARRPAAPADADWKRYAALTGSNIFSEQRMLPPPPKPIKLPPLPFPTPARPPEPPRPDVSGWSYVGYVTLDGKTIGILQNDTTHTCKYLAVGSDFMGATVEQVDREAMRLKSNGSVTTLSRPRDFPITPLSKGPGAPTPAPPQPQPSRRGP